MNYLEGPFEETHSVFYCLHFPVFFLTFSFLSPLWGPNLRIVCNWKQSGGGCQWRIDHAIVGKAEETNSRLDFQK